MVHRRAWCQYMGCIVVASSTPISSMNLCRLHAGVSSLWHGPSDATAATWDKLRHMVKVIPNPCLGGTLVCLAFYAQECSSRAAVQNYQVGFGRTLVGICCCASCMLLSRGSARLCCCAGRVSDIGSAKHCWLRPAVPTLQFSRQAQDATPLGANSLLTPLSQPSGRRAGQCAVQQADGPWCAGQTAACQ